MHARSRALLFLVALGAAATLAAPVPRNASDWPQWRGPERTGVSTETGLLKEWPKGGPRLLWKATGLGGGYATVALVGGRIYTTGSKGLEASGRGGRRGETESVLCLDGKDGKEIWATAIGKTAGGYPCPRCTPTVEGDRVYALSSDGNLVCLEKQKGGIVWKKDLKADYGGKTGNWAYAESPLIDGDRLICTPGGDAAAMLCLNKNTGKEVWQTRVVGLTIKAGKGGKGGRPGRGKGKGGRGGKGSYSTAGYSSAVVGTIAGEKTYVQFLTGGVVGVSARTGKLLWHYDHPSLGRANAATPLIKGDAVFAASAYGNGGGRADIVKAGDGFKAEEKYFVKEMQNHHGGMVLVGGHIYGTGTGSLVCIDFKTGEVIRQVRAAGKGSVAYADGMIYHRGEGGTMCLIEADPKTLAEKGRFTPPDRSGEKSWSHPVIAGGKLYLRDWDTLLVYDVSGKK